MPESKAHAEEQTKKAEAQVIHKMPEVPEKQHGPQRASLVQAATEHRGTSTPERAQQMTTMQQTVGNARVARMMGTAHKEPGTHPIAEEQEKGIDREHTPRMIAAKEKAEEMLHG